MVFPESKSNKNVEQNLEAIEKQAIEACKRGNLTCFAELYDLYVEKIYAFIYYRTRHRQLAEDLVSKTFVKALTRIGSYDSDRGSFSAWIYTIARNVIRDHFRTEKQNVPLDEVWEYPTSSLPESDVENRIELNAVSEYLSKLSPHIRQLIVMRVWDGLSFADISEITGKSESSLKVAYSRALTRLRKDLPQATSLILLLSQVLNQ